MMTKNLVYIIDFLCQIKILLLNMLKIPGFLFKFSQIPDILCLNCQIPGFSKFSSKVATQSFIKTIK